MPRPRSATRELVAAVLSLLVAVAGAVTIIGNRARLVHVLTILAGGFSAGVGFTRAIDRIRAERRTAGRDAIGADHSLRSEGDHVT